MFQMSRKVSSLFDDAVTNNKFLRRGLRKNLGVEIVLLQLQWVRLGCIALRR